jgi:hypothetical protein
VALYAEHAVLLPRLSNKPRVTPEENEDYFRHFWANKPSGRIDFRRAQVGCNSLVDTGLYTFTYGTTGAQIKRRCLRAVINGRSLSR